MGKGYRLHIGFDKNNNNVGIDILDGKNVSCILYGTSGSGVSNEVEYICKNLSSLIMRRGAEALFIDGTGYDEIGYWYKNKEIVFSKDSTFCSLNILGKGNENIESEIRAFKGKIIERYDTLQKLGYNTWKEYNTEVRPEMYPLFLFINGIGGIVKFCEWVKVKTDLEVIFRFMRSCGAMVFINAFDADSDTISMLANYATSTICLRSKRELAMILTRSELPSEIVEKTGFAYLYNPYDCSLTKFKTGAVKDGKLGRYQIKTIIEFIEE